jgi:hypothetical protein
MRQTRVTILLGAGLLLLMNHGRYFFRDALTHLIVWHVCCSIFLECANVLTTCFSKGFHNGTLLFARRKYLGLG